MAQPQVPEFQLTCLFYTNRVELQWDDSDFHKVSLPMLRESSLFTRIQEVLNNALQAILNEWGEQRRLAAEERRSRNA